MLQGKQLGFIGGGAIAEALIKGILQAKLVRPSQVTVSDIVADRLQYLEKTHEVGITADNQEIAAKADVLFLAVKPQIVQSALENIRHAIKGSVVVVSIAAGIPIASIETLLPGVAVVRVMPNTPVFAGAGMSVLSLGSHTDRQAGDTVLTIFESVGKAIILPESSMDAVTGLSGSGPGYAFVIIDALSDAGVNVGLSRQTATMLAAQTIFGAAKMVLETGEHPAKLRDMVTSPGGTTIAGIYALEQSGIRAALINAVETATARSKALGKK